MPERLSGRAPRGVQRLASATRRGESRPSRIGPISFGVKQMGARNAGNPHVACDVEGAGNVVWVGTPGPHRRASPRPYRCAGGGAGGAGHPPPPPRRPPPHAPRGGGRERKGTGAHPKGPPQAKRGGNR